MPVAIKKDQVTIYIGHLPRKISRSCSLFLKRGVVLQVNSHSVKLSFIFHSKKISCIKFFGVSNARQKFLLRRIFLDLW